MKYYITQTESFRISFFLLIQEVGSKYQSFLVFFFNTPTWVEKNSQDYLINKMFQFIKQVPEKSISVPILSYAIQ